MMVRKIVVMMVAVMCMALVLGALGCGDSKPNPEDTVNAFWSAVQRGDYQTAKTYFASSMTSTSLDQFEASKQAGMEDLGAAFAKTMDLKTVSHTTSGDNATVIAKLTIPDMTEVFSALDEAMNSASANATDPTQIDFAALMTEIAEQVPAIIKDAPTTTEDVSIGLVWEDGTWKITDDPFSELQSILNGMP
jgi:hypothetical protein